MSGIEQEDTRKEGAGVGIGIAVVGAGSMQFTRQVVSDLCRTEVGRDALYHLMDIDAERLTVASAMVRRIIEEAHGHGVVEAFPSLEGAFHGVDYVVNAIQVGGYDATRIDFDVPARYGIRQTIADTLGIGGIFRALRTIPAVLDIADAVAEQSPSAVLLNYTNPLSMVMMAVGRRYPELAAYGLCHSVHYTAETLAGYLGVPPEAMAFTSAGINHMAWMLELRHDDRDLYPALFRAARDPAIRDRDLVRFELMERLGYFVTESSEHNAEYSAHFLPFPGEVERLKIPVGEYLRRSERHLDEYAAMKEALLEPAPTLWLPESPEYAPAFIAAREEGRLWWFQANLLNRGYIANLSPDAAVEVPCFVSRHGVFPSAMGPLPEPLAAMNRNAINVQLLTVEALNRRDRDLVYQAAMMDPLLGAQLTLDQIWRLVDDLLAAHGEAVPHLPSRRLWRMAGGQHGSGSLPTVRGD